MIRTEWYLVVQVNRLAHRLVEFDHWMRIANQRRKEALEVEREVVAGNLYALQRQLWRERQRV